MKEVNAKVSFNLPIILTLIFLVLRLCKVITWKWVFVFMPIIVSAGIGILALIVLGFSTIGKK